MMRKEMFCMVNFWEVVRRAETGPKVEDRDFDMKYVALKILELQKEHNIRYDPDVIVPVDNGLADSVWQAAIELLLHSGVYYTHTGRVIKFTEEEIRDELKNSPPQITLGEGEDAVTIRSRRVEDSALPTVFGGPFGAPMTEEMFVKINQAYAQERLIDVLFMPGHLERIEGLDIREHSPTEVQAARCFAEWTREAIRRAGRPGMPMQAVAAGVTSVNEVAASDPEKGLRRSDLRIVNFLAELKVNAVFLSKAAHYINYGCHIGAGIVPFVGGFGGDPAGTAIVATAQHIAARLVYKAVAGFGPQHIKYGQQSNPHSLFMCSLAGQAISRNSHILRSTTATVSAYPPSKQNLLEGAAIALTAVVSGSNISGGPRPARTFAEKNQVSPLATRLFAEVGRSATGITRENANEILKALVKKYFDNIPFEKAARGRPFEESYDTSTLKPKKETLDFYHDAKEELRELGVALRE
jgi:methylamine--corrinoid protein Co-methyltransferase